MKINDSRSPMTPWLVTNLWLIPAVPLAVSLVMPFTATIKPPTSTSLIS